MVWEKEASNLWDVGKVSLFLDDFFSLSIVSTSSCFSANVLHLPDLREPQNGQLMGNADLKNSFCYELKQKLVFTIPKICNCKRRYFVTS